MPQNMNDMIKIKIIKKSPSPAKAERARPAPARVPPPVYAEPLRQKPNTGGPRYMLWMVALVSMAFLFFAISYMFSSAYVTIDPKTEEVAINENLVAEKDSAAAPVAFDLVVISGEETKKIQAKEKKNIEIPARGTVIIYNDFSPKPQMLSIDTRLEGSNGKLYKTEKQVVVPGQKDGKPGSLEVGIYAAMAGAEYDSSPLDFKIFGFKGSPKYAKIYARSKGDITGGTKGEFYTVPEEEKGAILEDLKISLEAKLLKKATEQIPKGFILFKDAVFLSTNDTSMAAYSLENPIPASLKGTLYGFLFEEEKLTKKIAAKVLPSYDGGDIYIADIKNLSFTLANKENISFADVKVINFNIKGASSVVWKFDEAKFKGELLEKKKKDFNSIVAGYPTVASAHLNLKPFWRMSFPGKLNKINVTVNYPK